MIRAVYLRVEYRRTEERSNLREPVTTTFSPDDFLRYRRNIVSVGIKALRN